MEKLIALTPCELKVLLLFARGFTQEEIAVMLFNSWHTIKTHAENIRHKLQAKNMTQAVTIAFCTGILLPDIQYR